MPRLDGFDKTHVPSYIASEAIILLRSVILNCRCGRIKLDVGNMTEG